MTTVRVSIRKAQEASSSPEVIQRATGTFTTSPPKPTWKKAIHDSTAAIPTNAVVKISVGRVPMARPKNPAIMAPMSGRKTMA